MSAKLSTLQTEIAGFLQAAALFSGTPIPVLSENLKDIDSAVDMALGVVNPASGSTKIGALAIVLTPSAVATTPNVPGPYFDEVEGLVRVVEIPTVNRVTGGTEKTALEIAEAAAAALHHQLTSDRKTVLVSSIKLVPDESALIYDVAFQTQIGL